MISSRTVTWVGAVGVFALLLVRPLLMRHLRAEEARREPVAWAALATNGSFALLGPHTFPTRYFDETLYANKVREILKHGAPFNPYWREDRDFSAWFFCDWLVSYLIALVAWLAGGTMNRGWSLALAAVGAAWFVFLHRLLRGWCARDKVAVPLALFGVVFPDVFVWLLDINVDLRLSAARCLSVFFYHGQLVLPHFYRLPSPFLSFLLAGMAGWAAWSLSISRWRPAAAVMVGLIFTALKPVHAYEWASAMATLGFFTAAFWVLGERRDGRLNLAVAFGVSVFGLVGLAYIEEFAGDPRARFETLAMLGPERTHRFYPQSLLQLLVAGLACALRCREADFSRRAAWLLLGCGQIAVFAGRNAQVILGFTIQPFHFIPIGSYLAGVLALLWLAERLSNVRAWSRSVAIAATGALVLWGLGREIIGAHKSYRFFGIPRDIDEAMSFVRRRLPQEALVLSLSMPANVYLPLYTQAVVQAHPASGFLSAPFTRERYFGKVAQLLRSVDADADRFIKDRWPQRDARGAAVERLNRMVNGEGRTDLEALGREFWFHDNFYGTEQHWQDQLRSLVREVQPVAGRWYFWLEGYDKPLLRHAPEQHGGRLLFQNAGVSIYAFGVPAKPSHRTQ